MFEHIYHADTALENRGIYDFRSLKFCATTPWHLITHLCHLELHRLGIPGPTFAKRPDPIGVLRACLIHTNNTEFSTKHTSHLS